MLRVTIELIPKGAEEKKRNLAVLEVSNVAETQDGLADYRVAVVDGEAQYNRVPRVTICRWRRSLGLLPLLIRVMETVERHARLS